MQKRAGLQVCSTCLLKSVVLNLTSLSFPLCVLTAKKWAKSDTKPHYEDIWFLIELKNGLKCSFLRQNKAFINIQLKDIKAFAF